MNQKGFTLFELVVVICILGILSATAVPKFLSIQTDARISTLEDTIGRIVVATGIANGKAEFAGGYPRDGAEHTVNGIIYANGEVAIRADNIHNIIDLDPTLFVRDSFDGSPELHSILISYDDLQGKPESVIHSSCRAMIRTKFVKIGINYKDYIVSKIFKDDC
ncbi:type II secretion system protein [Vibrio sp. Vb339]|uniref:type II secretion system protein n=1 Tax=Vibrio sp. Vb339 TaxID=1192013 RepID=UPI0015520087|nr:prepilin-type N-terminal cleavage/methylation domain-containing protein [Vibrio sp. Vb339]